nr:metallophosphoesterase family protein [Spirochaetia bacterium]
MKTLHIADLHFQRDRYDEAAASVRSLCADIDKNGADLVVIAGDTWDGPVQNTAGARFADFLEIVREVADRAPVAMIYGTPSHDTEGSLEVFERIQAKHGIEILRPGLAYGLTRGRKILAIADELPAMGDAVIAILFGVPEPNKKWLLANAGATGKDEADASARAALRALFMGLGGLRKKHPDLPCVLLYHGEVAGAKSATGYGAEAGVGLAVTRDDLAAVGADYIALGHIHEPQKIGDLPAFYPGSIYPINWGETHKAGANRVEIMSARAAGSLGFEAPDFSTYVTRVDFPHPARMKLSVRDVDGIGLGIPKTPTLIWYEITCTREEAADIDAEALTARIIADGALPGSRVTVNVLPTETVRAAEITEQRTLAEKVRVWAEASALEVPVGVNAKAAELEAEGSSDGAGRGAHIRIDRLILRGAIGIWKKSRKDEIDLDLAGYGAGVLALVGSNGAGKTTIIENLHPWPAMLTRDGTLRDHFRLRDSCRDLYFTDEQTGVRYRALITIRADIASGATEYYLYRDTGSGFEPLPGINGRKEPYEAAVTELFGSLELYLRTAFQ